MKNKYFVLRKRKDKLFEDSTWIVKHQMPNYSSELITLFACGESLFQPGFQQGSYPLGFWSLEYICEGQYTVIAENNNRIQVNPGEVLIHYPGVIYQRMNHGSVPMRKKEIMLNKSPIISILCNRSALNGQDVIRCTDPATVETYFDRIRELASAPDTDDMMERTLPNTIFALFTELIAQQGENNIYDSFEVQLKKFDVFSPDLTLKKMADYFKVGERTLDRWFKKHLNLSPFQYVVAMRMQYALQLLGSNSMQIREVAEECGYRNTSFFIAEFKKYFHKTPGEYRNSKTDLDNRIVYLLDGWNRLPKPRKPRRNSTGNKEKQG